MQDSISPASSSYHHLCDSYSIYLKLSFGHSLIQHKFFEHQYAKDYARQQTDEIVTNTVIKLQEEKNNIDT